LPAVVDGGTVHALPTQIFYFLLIYPRATQILADHEDP